MIQKNNQLKDCPVYTKCRNCSHYQYSKHMSKSASEEDENAVGMCSMIGYFTYGKWMGRFNKNSHQHAQI